MKILLCGEGPHDIGIIDHWSIDPNKQIVKPGWLQALLIKLLGKDIEFIIVPRNRLASLPRKIPKPLPPGHGLKAALAKFRASSDGCDLLIFMIDADCTDPKIWSQKVSDILEGFKVIGENIPSVACVPMSASESWLLADPESWTIMGLGDLSILPKKPEEIWGTKIDPDSNHPHSVFSKICAAAGKEDNRETRFDVMSTSNIKSIIGRCPVSFVHFYNCMHTFIEEISV